MASQTRTRVAVAGASLVALLAAFLVAGGNLSTFGAAPSDQRSVGRVDTCTTNSQGSCTINHGYGEKPSAVVVTPSGAQGFMAAVVNPANTSATSYTVTFFKHDGTRWASTAITWNAVLDFAPLPPPDTTAPDTSITSAPVSGTTSTSASFQFTATESPATFECRIDAGSFAACASPKAYSGLTAGSHTFAVQAKDAAGNTDASPATHAWDIAAAPPPPAMWVPTPGAQWQWQLGGQLSAADYAMCDPLVSTCYTPPAVKAFDVDGFENSAATVAAIKARQAGTGVICYISAGTFEDWRPDASSFPEAVKGSGNGWPGEKWLDIRAISTLQPIMAARMQMCKDKGFDSVEPDNIDGYSNNTGFPLTGAQQITYNKMLATEAHNRGMSITLKNDVDQITALEPFYDYALNEECYRYSECDGYTAFSSKGKAVLITVYRTADMSCANATANGWALMRKNLDLDRPRYICP